VFPANTSVPGEPSLQLLTGAEHESSVPPQPVKTATHGKPRVAGAKPAGLHTRMTAIPVAWAV
jgi:hypothetical protein